jgi:hypothetical protein
VLGTGIEKSLSQPHLEVCLSDGSLQNVNTVPELQTPTPMSFPRHNTFPNTNEYYHKTMDEAFECNPEYNLEHVFAAEGYSPMYQEEIFWDVQFGGFAKIYDSKLFLFAGIYWNMSFGLNDDDSPYRGYYYLHLTPAQKLFQEARLMCEFRIYKESTVVYSCRSTQDLVFFPHDDHINHGPCQGFHRFFDENICHRFVNEETSFRKLHLSVLVATDVGPVGELIGCSYYLFPDNTSALGMIE